VNLPHLINQNSKSTCKTTLEELTQRNINLLLLRGMGITTPDRSSVSYFVDYETLEYIIKWQGLAWSLRPMNALDTGFKNWGNMFVKAEFIQSIN